MNWLRLLARAAAAALSDLRTGIRKAFWAEVIPDDVDEVGDGVELVGVDRLVEVLPSERFLFRPPPHRPPFGSISNG